VVHPFVHEREHTVCTICVATLGVCDVPALEIWLLLEQLLLDMSVLLVLSQTTGASLATRTLTFHEVWSLEAS